MSNISESSKFDTMQCNKTHSMLIIFVISSPSRLREKSDTSALFLKVTCGESQVKKIENTLLSTRGIFGSPSLSDACWTEVWWKDIVSWRGKKRTDLDREEIIAIPTQSFQNHPVTLRMRGFMSAYPSENFYDQGIFQLTGNLDLLLLPLSCGRLPLYWSEDKHSGLSQVMTTRTLIWN